MTLNKLREQLVVLDEKIMCFMFVRVVAGKVYAGLWESTRQELIKADAASLSTDCKQERILSGQSARNCYSHVMFRISRISYAADVKSQLTQISRADRRENLHDGRALPVRTFGSDIFRGLQIGRGDKCFFGQFFFDVVSVACVTQTIVHSCVAVSFMSGHRLL